MAGRGCNATGRDGGAQGRRVTVRRDRDASSESSANGATACADGDGHAPYGSGAAGCDRAIMDEGGATGVIVRASGRAHDRANGGECDRGLFSSRGDGANLRVSTIRPSFHRRGHPRGGGADREVSATWG